jgi:diguanylate cyclase (GGDEF)-like protein
MPAVVSRAYLTLGAIAVASYLFAPAGLPRDLVYLAVGVVGAGAIAAGVLAHRPVRRAAWWWMAAGQLLWAAGDVVYVYYDHALKEAPYPSLADAFYLGAYPLLAVGVALLVRGRRSGRDREGLIDSAIFTVSVNVLSWVFLMRPTVDDSSLSLMERGLGMAYPLGDLLLIGVLVRMLTGPGARTVAFRLLALAVLLQPVADTVYSVSTLTASYDGAWVRLLWLGSYVLWGAAALHPSMRTLSLPAADPVVRFTRRRLLALTTAILAAPATLAIQLTLGMILDGWAVVIGAAVLSVLVLVRMYGLITRVERQADQLAAMARTDALTGLPNRRSADAALGRLADLAVRQHEPLAVAMVDVDHFKAFNDTYGHQAGDRLLAEAAGAWRRALPDDAFLARYGGEEFLLVLRGRQPDDAADIAERLRAVTPAGQTVSVGLASWDRDEDLQALVHRADVALYAAKRAGRDRVVAAPVSVPALV